MKPFFPVDRAGWFLPALFLAALLAGCATGPKIDWNSRIGDYSYDQAVTDLGPPDKFAKLTDGSIVAEWLIYRSYPSSSVYFGGGYGFCHPYFYPWYGPTVYYHGGYSYETFLRLNFGPDGKLKAWKKFDR